MVEASFGKCASRCRDYEGESRWVFPTEVRCFAPRLSGTAPSALNSESCCIDGRVSMQDNYFIKDLIQRLEGKSGSAHRSVLLHCCH